MCELPLCLVCRKYVRVVVIEKTSMLCLSARKGRRVDGILVCSLAKLGTKIAYLWSTKLNFKAAL